MPATKKSTKHSLGNGKRQSLAQIKKTEKFAKQEKAAKKATKKGKGK